MIAASMANVQRHLDPDFTFLRALLVCDNSSCNKKNPSVKCTSCEAFYYCSTKCRGEHWNAHEWECRLFSCERSNEPIIGTVPPDAEEPQKAVGINEKCGICFAKDMVRPMVLSCGHVFCAFCIGALQGKHHEPPPLHNACPYCRVNTSPDILDDVVDHGQAMVHCGRSLWDCDFVEGAKAMFSLAIVEHEQYLKADPTCVMTLVHLASILMRTTEDPNEAIEIANVWIEKAATLATLEALELNHKFYGRAQFTDQQIVLAQSYEAAGDYGKAMSLYKEAKDLEYKDFGGDFQLDSLDLDKGLSRTAYHLGDYKAAIGFIARLLFEPTRCQSGIHRLVAKPLLALYEQDKANKAKKAHAKTTHRVGRSSKSRRGDRSSKSRRGGTSEETTVYGFPPTLHGAAYVMYMGFVYEDQNDELNKRVNREFLQTLWDKLGAEFAGH